MSRNGLFRTLIIGTAGGAFLGLLELWFFTFDIRHFAAAIVAGSTYGLIMSLAGALSVQPGRARTLAVSGLSGVFSAFLWWVIARPGTPLPLALAIGLLLGLVIILFGL